MDKYLFSSDRLGFRNWMDSDLPDFIRLNADPEVMEYFPRPLTPEETMASMERFQRQFSVKGYTYFAADLLQTGEFIGFIGLSWQDYQAPFTPATDIGWRLLKEFWGKGYATEGAKQCLEFAFENLNLEEVVSVCPATNLRSELVMKKIGMQEMGKFEHPGLLGLPRLNPCVWYELKKA
ncbi:MAG: GNAT family N-acetyltransferase [Flavobacteriaceae bacterium]|jgi:RimJ/RimL family protein N-acetyltransferase|nr:MAG: GNAT family N-acetyltransferase [Flavobacteriaceae bacterium]